MSKTLAAIASFVCVFGSAAAHAALGPDLVVNGSFESPSVGGPALSVPAGSTAMTPWTVIGDSGIDLVNTFWNSAEGVQSISLNWISPSTLTQTILTELDRPYRVRFALSAETVPGGPAQRDLRITWNGNQHPYSVDATGKTPTNMGWTYHEIDVMGTGSDLLALTSMTDGDWGAAIDDVSVRARFSDGDLNQDWVVDIFDVNIISDSWGEAGGEGDANGDGVVDIFDVNVVSDNWTVPVEATAVPEPATLMLAAIGACAMIVSVRRSNPRR
jgi:choice-of-anchor C domain-containing protein